MTEGFSRQATTSNTSRTPAAVVSLDVQTRTAVMLTRSKYTVNVNCAYAVGDTIVTPAIGEQWYIERFDMEWRLAGRIPFNDDTLNIEPEPGQVSVGAATGPLELNGTEVRANGTLRLDGVLLRDTGTRLERSTDGGTTWIPVVPPAGPGAPASTDEVPEGVTNKYYTAARVATDAPVKSVAAKTGIVTLVKGDVGLGNVDNTTDNAKPISAATAIALLAKADLASGIVPDDQLPTPRVRQFDDFGDFPFPGADSTIYIADDTGNLYRWNGSAYDLSVAGAGTLSNSDELPEGVSNLYYTDARVQTKVNTMYGTAADTICEGDDARLSNTRTPTNNTVTTAKIVDANVTLAKLASDVQTALAASPYDVSYPQTIGVRAVGYGQATIGVQLQRDVIFTKVTYRCATADNSGSSTFEIRKNGVAVPGTSLTIIAANQVAGDSITGTFAFAENDILTIYTTAVGGAPVGLGLVADLKGDA